MSGIDIGGQEIRKGAADAVVNYVRSTTGNRHMPTPRPLQEIVERVAKAGGTPLVVARNGQILGVIHLKDIVKGGINERFGELRRMGIRTVMVTGDNPLTAAAIAAEAGVDDFLAGRHRKPSSSSFATSRRKASWWQCAATVPTMRRHSPRPTSAWR